MKSKDVTVEDYINDLDGENKLAITKLREIAYNLLKSFKESMKY